jgi:hypothetical protein
MMVATVARRFSPQDLHLFIVVDGDCADDALVMDIDICCLTAVMDEESINSLLNSPHRMLLGELIMGAAGALVIVLKVSFLISDRLGRFFSVPGRLDRFIVVGGGIEKEGGGFGGCASYAITFLDVGRILGISCFGTVRDYSTEYLG